jgi:hypothetical protein
LGDAKIAALAADGFKRFELVIPLRVLKLAGARIDVVSYGPDVFAGWSRGPQDMAAFVPAKLDAFARIRRSRGRQRRVASPIPPSAPLGMAVDAMRWLPKPSTASAAMVTGLVVYDPGKGHATSTLGSRWQLGALPGDRPARVRRCHQLRRM